MTHSNFLSNCSSNSSVAILNSLTGGFWQIFREIACFSLKV